MKFHLSIHSYIHLIDMNLLSAYSMPGNESTKMNELWFLLDLEISHLVEKDRYKSVFQSKVISAMMELCLLNQTGENAIREVIAEWSFRG